MKTIKLTKGKFALVDDEEKIFYKYHTFDPKRCRTYYAKRGKINKNKKYTIFLHREIMERILGRKLGIDEEVDHIDGNGWNCQRNNLRNVSKSQNRSHVSKTRTYKGKQPSSIFKGVCFNQNGWICQIRHHGKKIYIGFFHDEIEAAKAYDAKAIELQGIFAHLNFPNRD